MPVQGLSCYTANLHGYLDAEWDAGRLLGSSIRLAVRFADDGIAFSHHEPSLDRLPDGSFLRYAGSDSATAALPSLTDELSRHGRVLVVVDSARLPWSVAYGSRPAPHWLLVDGYGAGEWHVVDDFTALVPDGGEQRAYRGWLRTARLCSAMTLPTPWPPAQQHRNAMAFGSPVPVPATPALWLHRGGHAPSQPDGVPAVGGGWLVGDAAVLPFLARHLAVHEHAARHLEDLWAAAGHRCFAYRWRLAGDCDERVRLALRLSLAKWERLPRMLRIAVESVERGRPRPALVRAALEALLPVREGQG